MRIDTLFSLSDKLWYFLSLVSTQIIFYFNYRSLGYEWSQVFYYIIRTGDFVLFVVSAITLMIIVFYRGPSRSPFFEELQIAIALAFSAPLSKISSSADDSTKFVIFFLNWC